MDWIRKYQLLPTFWTVCCVFWPANSLLVEIICVCCKTSFFIFFHNKRKKRKKIDRKMQKITWKTYIYLGSGQSFKAFYPSFIVLFYFSRVFHLTLSVENRRLWKLVNLCPDFDYVCLLSKWTNCKDVKDFKTFCSFNVPLACFKFHENVNNKKTVRNVMAYRIISKISGRAFSRSFIRSFMAATIVLALSSAPCLLLFSAAPVNKKLYKI